MPDVTETAPAKPPRVRDKSHVATAEDVRALLAYSKVTGLLTWRSNRSRTARQGDEAGTIAKDGTIIVSIYNRAYTAARVIFLLVTGDWPQGRLIFKDSDSTNLRWSNLLERREVLSNTRNAVYQRRYRKMRAVAMRRLLSDPHVTATYQNLDAISQRSMFKRLMDRVADDMIRNASDPADR